MIPRLNAVLGIIGVEYSILGERVLRAAISIAVSMSGVL